MTEAEWNEHDSDASDRARPEFKMKYMPPQVFNCPNCAQVLAAIPRLDMEIEYERACKMVNKLTEECGRLKDALREILEYPEERASYAIAEKILEEDLC